MILQCNAEDSLGGDLITPSSCVGITSCQFSSLDQLHIIQWWVKHMEGHIDLVQTRSFVQAHLFKNYQ